MVIFAATLDPSGIVSGADKAKSAVGGLGNSFDDMQKRSKAGNDLVAASLENLAKKALATFSIYKGFDLSRNATFTRGEAAKYGRQVLWQSQ